MLLYLGQRDYIQCQGENEDIHGVVYSKVGHTKNGYYYFLYVKCTTSMVRLMEMPWLKTGTTHYNP